MTHRLHESLSDEDFRNLARLISACTLGLWAFAAGLLIGTFLFSWSRIRARHRSPSPGPLAKPSGNHFPGRAKSPGNVSDPTSNRC